MRIEKSQKIEWIKASGRSVVLSLILVGMAWGYLIVADALPGYYWEMGFLSIGAVLIYFVGMSIAGQLSRNAFLFHLLYSVGMLFIVVPLLSAGQNMLNAGGISSKSTLITVIVGSIILFSQEARSVFQGLRKSEQQNISAGRIDENNNIWSLTSDLYIHGKNVSDRETELKWWKLTSPFLPGIGFAISRKLPDSILTLFGAYLILFLAILVAVNYGRQLGIAIYLQQRTVRA